MHKQLPLLFHLVVDSYLYYTCSSTRINTRTYVLSPTPTSIPVSVLIPVYSGFIYVVHVPQGIVLHMHCSTHSYLNSAVTYMNELKVQLPELTKARNIFSFIT